MEKEMRLCDKTEMPECDRADVSAHKSCILIVPTAKPYSMMRQSGSSSVSSGS
jgi:hypothetical protein